ncbi:hypothetical protein GCM10023144_01570 [Pigmentiphaga soli]|uniref:Uncharacterized protein n=1 Tax=Pigmentiphaga soli TaxID=1007095 RepID=A0ABP8GCX5_9BURK
MRLIATILLPAAICAGIFAWGQYVGRRDVLLLVADEARAEKVAVIQCGRRALVAKDHDGALWCVRVNPDGSALVLPVFDSPVGAM